jgi:GNAT superfamily N-acetyltransferase
MRLKLAKYSCRKSWHDLGHSNSELIGVDKLTMKPEAFIRNLHRAWKIGAIELIRSGARSGFLHSRPTYGHKKRKAIFCNIEGQLAGILTYDVFGRRPRSRVFKIDLICVEPKFRKLGVGTAMLGLCFQKALRSNCRSVAAEVKSTNSPSLALMRANGFAEAPPDELNVIVFYKRLAEGSDQQPRQR